MRIVKELWRAVAVVWMILLMAVIVDAMTQSAEACGSPDCVPTSTPYPTGTLVPTDESTNTPKPGPTKTEKPDDDDPTRTPKPTDDDPTRTPKSTGTPKPTKTPDPIPDPTDVPKPTAVSTERPHDCHVDGDGICPGEESPTPAFIVFTPLPPKPVPTLAPTERMVEIVPQTISCSNICCSACCGCFEQAGIGSEVVDYSDVILEFKPIAYILLGIFGVNTLLRTYGTFRKD